MSSPLVSIIIPCHNAARWLRETLESALGQTWPHKEIILVDDGSTDDSLAVARQFEPRAIRILLQGNAGAAAARNAGLRAAHGEFLQFLDADDLISPRKIECQVALLHGQPTGTLATCRWGRFRSGSADAAFVDEMVYRDFAPVKFLQLAGSTGAMIHPSAWLVPRNVADQAGPWDESLSLNDDGEYFARVALASARIAFCSDPAALAFYRSGLSGSLSRRRDARAVRSQFRSIELICDHLRRAEDSVPTRHACAGYWRRFVHDYFPAEPALVARAEAEVAHAGEALGRPPLGPKASALAALLGWRTVRRLQRALGQ